MFPLAVLLILAFGLRLPLNSQTTDFPKNSPSVLISLPPNIPSENVAVRYFMSGPFGGYGGYLDSRSGLHSYQIVAAVEGEAATAIKIIVYAAGCRFRTFEIALSQVSRVDAQFVCEALPRTPLRGQMESKIPAGQDVELTVPHQARWSHEFFRNCGCPYSRVHDCEGQA